MLTGGGLIMTTRECVANRIIELCRERNMTINGLARLSALPPSTLKNIVNGVSQNPGIVTIKKLCDGLEITLVEFFRHRGVQGSGAGDPVTLPTILGFAGTIRHQETSYFRG